MLKRLKGMFTHQAKSNATTTRATTITLVEEKSAKKELKRIGQSWRAEPHPNEDEVESRYLSLVLVARETALSGPVTTLLTVVDLDFSCSELSSRSRGVKDGALGGDVLERSVGRGSVVVVRGWVVVVTSIIDSH
jgi:hypothetical protein